MNTFTRYFIQKEKKLRSQHHQLDNKVLWNIKVSHWLKCCTRKHASRTDDMKGGSERDEEANRTITIEMPLSHHVMNAIRILQTFAVCLSAISAAHSAAIQCNHLPLLKVQRMLYCCRHSTCIILTNNDSFQYFFLRCVHNTLFFLSRAWVGVKLPK